MLWKDPPIIKIYEALGTIADGRIEVSNNTAKVFSSNGNKFYTVSYDSSQNAIMANDNGSYWHGYLGYPAIAYLLKAGVLEYKSELAELLKGIKWKELNTKHKNDFAKTLDYIEISMPEKDWNNLQEYVQKLHMNIQKLNLSLLGKKALPPKE